MSRSAAHHCPPPALPRTPHVHPAVAELVPQPIVREPDGMEVLRAPSRPRTTQVIAFDTETTGRHGDARIVEFGMARVDLATGQMLTRWSSLVNPGVPIPRDASAVHGITDAVVRGAPSIGQVLARALALITRAGLPMVAHNAAFDLARIKYEAQRCDVPLPGTIPVHCSLVAARRLKPTRGAALQVLREHYKVTVAGDAHSAMGDIAVLAALLPHLLREPKAQGLDFRDCFHLEAML